MYTPHNNNLFIHCFTSLSRNFHLFMYGDVTITGEELQNVGLCSSLWAFEQRGIFIGTWGLDFCGLIRSTTSFNRLL
jgi:hypothetical protein